MLNRLLPGKRRRPNVGLPAKTAKSIPETPQTPETIVELDRWQLTGLLFGVLAIALVAFFVGRSVGRGAVPADPKFEPATLARSLPPGATSRERQIALAEVWPPTSGIDDSLSRPIAQPLPSDPTERARAEAHLQLQAARSLGLRDDAPPMNNPAPSITPQVPAGDQGGFTLQISLFDTQAAANTIAAQLESAGAPVRIRQVRTAGRDGSGGDLFRVEVGDFDTSEAALAFQRRFERQTGYSGVLITL